MKEESEKAGLKLNIQKTKIMASGLIASMANRWGKSTYSARLYFLKTPKSLQMVTAAMNLKDACSLKKKAMTNLDGVLKSRDITLQTKVSIVKAMVFPVVIHGYARWTKG